MAKGGKVAAKAAPAAPKKGAGGTSTSSDVRSPTSTSTKADTRGNFTSTVTGGAGKGATNVKIHVPGLSKGGQKYAKGGSVKKPKHDDAAADKELFMGLMKKEDAKEKPQKFAAGGIAKIRHAQSTPAGQQKKPSGPLKSQVRATRVTM